MSNIWTLFCLLHLVTELSQGSQDIKPREPHFYSVNLRNILEWRHSTDAGSRTTYTVEFAIYGDEGGSGLGQDGFWRPVSHCQEILQAKCDLTGQTYNLDDAYYARVRAMDTHITSDWAITERFNPMAHTILGPPEVHVSVANSRLLVKLKGPMRWRHGNVTKNISLRKIFPHMSYNITVLNNSSKQANNFPVRDRSLSLDQLESGTQYCVAVKAYSRSIPIPSITSSWRCITTPDDPFGAQMLVMMLGGIVPSAIFLFLLAVVGGVAYRYIFGTRGALPKSTDLMHIPEHKTLCPEKPSIEVNFNLIVTNLTLGETKTANLPLLPHLNQHVQRFVEMTSGLQQGGAVETEVCKGEEPPACYAAQALPVSHAFSTGSEDPPSTTSGDGSYGLVVQGPVESCGTDPEGYGLLVPKVEEGGSDCNESSPSPDWLHSNPYRAKMPEPPPDETNGNDNCSTFLDWSPDFGILSIPLLPPVPGEGKGEQCPPTSGPSLPSVVIRQSSQDSSEQDILTTMENTWGLQVTE